MQHRHIYIQHYYEYNDGELSFRIIKRNAVGIPIKNVCN